MNIKAKIRLIKQEIDSHWIKKCQIRRLVRSCYNKIGELKNQNQVNEIVTKWVRKTKKIKPDFSKQRLLLDSMLKQTIQDQTIGIYRLASTKDNEKKTTNLLDLDKFYKSVIQTNVVDNTLTIPKLRKNFRDDFQSYINKLKLDKNEFKAYCKRMLKVHRKWEAKCLDV